jgi:hypothetical protein
MLDGIVQQLKEPGSLTLFLSTVAISFAVCYVIFSRANKQKTPEKKDIPPPRNFTLAQLRVGAGSRLARGCALDTCTDSLTLSVNRMIAGVHRGERQTHLRLLGGGGERAGLSLQRCVIVIITT